MSRKTNPNNLKLGFYKIWNNFSQHYSTNLKFFTYLFYKYIISYNFVLKRLAQENVILHHIEFWYKTNKIFIKIYFINSLNSNKIFIKISHALFYWFCFNQNLKITVVLHNMNFYSSILIQSYIMYLFVNLNFSPKKILAIISDFITNKLNLKKLSYSKNGPLTCYLKGYKLILTGRFENTKTSMSKTLILKKGSLNSTSLNNRVDFFTKNLNTKFGLCNFKIWLFYKIS